MIVPNPIAEIPTNIQRKTDRTEVYAVIVLLLVSLAIVALQDIALRHSHTIEFDDSVKVTARDDRPFGGGSIAKVKKTPQGLEFTCEISDGFTWPYCEIWIDFNTPDTDGLNLSNYSRIGIWGRHEPIVQTGTRFQIHNYNSLYSIANDSETLKYNAVEYYEKFSGYPIWIDLDQFHVPTWWLTRHDLPLEEIGVDFSNSQSMAFVTGSHIQPGKYRMLIERVEFHGKYLQPADVFLGLVSLWVIAAVAFLYRSFVSARRNLKYAQQRQKEWEHRAVHDALTGCLNRIGLHKLFAKNVYGDSGKPLSIIYMDIDHFKSVNDNYGHSIGDTVLKEFAQCLMKNLSKQDTLARWGGEEFIIACKKRSVQEAAALAEALRKAVESHPWPEGIPVTSSFGVAEKTDESIDQFINRADNALYQAKENGRNRVEIAE